MAKKHKYTKGELDEYSDYIESYHDTAKQAWRGFEYLPGLEREYDYIDKDGNYDYTKLKAIKRRDEKRGLDLALKTKEMWKTGIRNPPYYKESDREWYDEKYSSEGSIAAGANPYIFSDNAPNAPTKCPECGTKRKGAKLM